MFKYFAIWLVWFVAMAASVVGAHYQYGKAGGWLEENDFRGDQGWKFTAFVFVVVGVELALLVGAVLLSVAVYNVGHVAEAY